MHDIEQWSLKSRGKTPPDLQCCGLLVKIISWGWIQSRDFFILSDALVNQLMFISPRVRRSHNWSAVSSSSRQLFPVENSENPHCTSPDQHQPAGRHSSRPGGEYDGASSSWRAGYFPQELVRDQKQSQNSEYWIHSWRGRKHESKLITFAPSLLDV